MPLASFGPGRKGLTAVARHKVLRSLRSRVWVWTLFGGATLEIELTFGYTVGLCREHVPKTRRDFEQT